MSPTKKILLTLSAASLSFFAIAAHAQEAVEETATETSETIEAQTADAKIVDHVFGEDTAPVTIVEYASFTCPHCLDFEQQVWPKVQEEFIDTGKAKLIYREVYFDGAGLLAASLARCVPAEQYYPMVFTLYSQTDAWLKSQTDVEGVIGELTKLGVMAGLPKDKIAACLDDRDSQEKMIANSAKLMSDDNVKGTPTILINGEKVENWQWDNLKSLIDKEYENASQ